VSSMPGLQVYLGIFISPPMGSCDINVVDFAGPEIYV
jgi:hypothetical protein